MTLDLPLIFTVLMGVAILAYVVLDGYDLGVGMLMPAADAREQDIMVSSIGPFWDANETWLVLGIGLLLVAFPVAHGVVLTALYLPVAAMLIGLMLRGVAFEFRVKAEGWHREMWNWLFWFGSFLASLAQGIMLGSYITGFEPGFGYFLFDLLVAGGLCGGYVLLGATWLIWRTEGALQQKAIGWTRWGLLWVALGVALVSIATPLASETVRDKWFDFPRTLGLMVLPLASLVAWLWVWRASGRIRKGNAVPDWAPFAGTIVIFALAFLGLAYSLFPYLVMDRITIWEAAAHPSSLKVVLIGALIVLPFILGWTVFVYRVFRGKATGTLYDH
ncbi:MAG TPA: cytochrome d ubiquinol oxidase subunit II [Burkholderiales bacterium]|nr:cytochrome d ubiquinol oxidase subunit II [Burkholderiales bacterium]